MSTDSVMQKCSPVVVYPTVDAHADADAHGVQMQLTYVKPVYWREMCDIILFHVQVYTAGGGARNAKWMAKLGVPVEASPQAEAAYGAALLARQGWRQRDAQQG